MKDKKIVELEKIFDYNKIRSDSDIYPVRAMMELTDSNENSYLCYLIGEQGNNLVFSKEVIISQDPQDIQRYR